MSPMIGLGILGGTLMGGAQMMSNMAAQRQASNAANQANMMNQMMSQNMMTQQMQAQQQVNQQMLAAQDKANKQKLALVQSLGPSVDPNKLDGLSTIETSPLGDQSKPNLAGNKILGN